jgi:hypothetical protein
MYYPVIYTGLTDLRDAIRDNFDADGYTFLRPESSEAEAAIASGEYASITYHGGDTATIEDFPATTPTVVDLPISSDGSIHGTLAAKMIRAHLEGWGDLGITDITERVARYRETGSV